MQLLNPTKTTSLLASLLMLAAVLSVATVQPAQSAGELTGNIGVVSQYVFRGAVESSEATVQGGFDYSSPVGVYAGYWASGLGDGQYQPGALENDFYLGYAGEAGPMSFDVGALQYVYTNDAAGVDNDANEVYGSLGFGPVSAGVTYTTKDVSWTSEGDIFATLSASQTVLSDLTLDGLVRYSSLEDRTLGSTGDDGLSQIEVGLSHPIGDSGADMSFRYIANDTENSPGGSDNQIVLGVNYGFDIAKK